MMQITPQAMALPPRDRSPAAREVLAPSLPKTPACYGFSILAKIIPGRESVFHGYAKTLEASTKEPNPISSRR